LYFALLCFVLSVVQFSMSVRSVPLRFRSRGQLCYSITSFCVCQYFFETFLKFFSWGFLNPLLSIGCVSSDRVPLIGIHRMFPTWNRCLSQSAWLLYPCRHRLSIPFWKLFKVFLKCFFRHSKVFDVEAQFALIWSAFIVCSLLGTGASRRALDYYIHTTPFCQYLFSIFFIFFHAKSEKHCKYLIFIWNFFKFSPKINIKTPISLRNGSFYYWISIYLTLWS